MEQGRGALLSSRATKSSSPPEKEFPMSTYPEPSPRAPRPAPPPPRRRSALGLLLAVLGLFVFVGLLLGGGMLVGAALVLGEGPSAGVHERTYQGKAGARDKIAVVKIDGVL